MPNRVKDYLIHDEGWKPDPVGDSWDDWKLNPAKSGEDYDDCPNPSCGSRDVEPLYRIGLDSRTFSCPCCRTTWNREGKEASAHNEDIGLGDHPRGTQAATTHRVTFTPTKRYSANYEKVFGHK